MTSEPRGLPLYESRFVAVEIYYSARVVLVRRTAEPFTRTQEIDAITAALALALPAERRKGFGVLLDMREAPTRVDPALEPSFGRFRRESERGFDRACVVVASAVGLARSHRLEREAVTRLTVVDSMDAAWKVLRAR